MQAASSPKSHRKRGMTRRQVLVWLAAKLPAVVRVVRLLLRMIAHVMTVFARRGLSRVSTWVEEMTTKMNRKRKN
jgi:hypothetical protein